MLNPFRRSGFNLEHRKAALAEAKAKLSVLQANHDFYQATLTLLDEHKDPIVSDKTLPEQIDFTGGPNGLRKKVALKQIDTHEFPDHAFETIFSIYRGNDKAGRTWTGEIRKEGKLFSLPGLNLGRDVTYNCAYKLAEGNEALSEVQKKILSDPKTPEQLAYALSHAVVEIGDMHDRHSVHQANVETLRESITRIAEKRDAVKALRNELQAQIDSQEVRALAKEQAARLKERLAAIEKSVAEETEHRKKLIDRILKAGDE